MIIKKQDNVVSLLLWVEGITELGSEIMFVQNTK